MPRFLIDEAEGELRRQEIWVRDDVLQKIEKTNNRPIIATTTRNIRNVRYPQTLDDPYSPCCRQRCLHFPRRRRRRRRRQSANTAASDSKSSHSINSS